MNKLTPTAHVGALVAERPGRARIFELYGIDYCCGGKKQLEEACAERGLDPRDVISALQEADSQRVDAATTDWSGAKLVALIDHIVSTHHAYLREALPRLSAMGKKVEQAHGERHGEIAECQQIYQRMRDELESHMLKEEQILFPAIQHLEKSRSVDAVSFGSIRGPITMMEQEHQSTGDAFRQLRRLTDDFSPPEDACNTWRAWLGGLMEMESDLRWHIHKENNILFPRAARLEEELQSAS